MKTETKSPQWHAVAKVDEVPLREGKKVLFKDFEVALFNLGNGFLAVDNRCPHKQGPLADGLVSGNAVFCPLHNWKINLTDGCAMSGGAGQVKIYPVKVVNQSVCIAFEEGKFGENISAVEEKADERL